jgi:hypothetical protein
MTVHVVHVPLLPHEAACQNALLLSLKRHVIDVLQGDIGGHFN